MTVDSRMSWNLNGLDVTQDVTVSSYSRLFFLITTFAPNGTRDFTSESSDLSFSDAAKLADKEWRRDVAWEHIERRCEQMRRTVAAIDRAVSTRSAK